MTPPPVPVERVYQGGPVEPSDILPPEAVPADEYKLHHDTVKVRGLLSREGVALLFTSPVGGFLSFAALAVILVVMVGVELTEPASSSSTATVVGRIGLVLIVRGIVGLV